MDLYITYAFTNDDIFQKLYKNEVQEVKPKFLFKLNNQNICSQTVLKKFPKIITKTFNTII